MGASDEKSARRPTRGQAQHTGLCHYDGRHFQIQSILWQPPSEAIPGAGSPLPGVLGLAEALPSGALSRDFSLPHSLLSPNSQAPQQKVRHPPAPASDQHTGDNAVCRPGAVLMQRGRESLARNREGFQGVWAEC